MVREALARAAAMMVMKCMVGFGGWMLTVGLVGDGCCCCWA